MKKYSIRSVSLLLLISLLFALCSFSTVAASDFTVEDGVLVSYSGSSKQVSIPTDVYCIADSAFMNNKTVESLKLNNVTVIGDNAFRGCSSLKTVTDYDSLSSCGAYAFYGTPFHDDRTAATLIMGSVLVDSNVSGAYTVPAGVESIAPYAFAQNTGITSVTIGDGVASVGEGAFWKCTNLKTVNISSQVSYIGAVAFEDTSYISSVKDEFLVLGNKILVKANTDATEITIPDGVKQIAAGAFYENSKLISVTMPDTVTAIGLRAFAGCSSLKAIDFPSGLLLLDDEAFYNCTSLADVTVPATVEILGESVFLGCTKLKTATFLSNVPLSDGLFAGCTSLVSVMVASDTPSVGDYAFYKCSALRALSLPETVTTVGDDAFTGCGNVSVYCYLDSAVGTYLKNKGISVCEIGDANEDGTLNIKDATQIQKATAGILTLSFSATLKADADFSGVVNVRDATRIQKKLAGLV